MFPYKLGENGGAVFLIPYFIFVILLGTVGLMAEFSLGRQFRVGSMTSIRNIFKEKNIKGGSILSIIPTIGLTGIFMFYTVVIGWILKYFFISLTGEISTIDTTSYFSTFTNSNSVVFWHGLAVLITLLIVSFGISKGIERVNKIIIPLLFIIFILLTLKSISLPNSIEGIKYLLTPDWSYLLNPKTWVMSLGHPLLFIIFILLTLKSISLPNSIEGIKYLLTPDWSYLLNPKTWVMSLGQAFFTVSLTGCCMVMCGSYTDEKFDIPNCAISTVLFDSLAALLAAFVIMPAVFALGFNPTAGPASYTDEKFDIPNCAISTVLFDSLAALLAAFVIMPAVFALGFNPTAGPALLFVTVPSIFQTMKFGQLLSALFFLSIIFASISSSIAMLEGPVEAIMLLFVTVPSIFQTMKFGQLLSALFFLSIIFASISSSIAMLEGPVEAIMNVTNWSRKKTTYITAIIAFILAIPLGLSSTFFDNFTNFITIVLSPLGALITAFIFFYILSPEETLNQLNLGAKYKIGVWFIKFGKYIFVPITVIVIILGVLYGGIG